MENNQNIEKMKQSLKPLYKRYGLALVLLFGSQALGKTHKYSDIDIAFLFEKDVTDSEFLNITNQTINLLKTDKVDLVNLNKASPLLERQVVKTGEVLYEKNPGIYAQFVSLAMRKYIDAKKIQQAKKSYVEKFISDRRAV
jgi:predicted nucleotidyltransferase